MTEPKHDAVPGYATRLSKHLPPSLGSFFGQPLEKVDARVPLPDAGMIAGARAAPELCHLVDQFVADLVPKDAVAEVKIDGLRCLYIGGRLFTREGSTFEAAEHCLPILRAIENVYGVPMFFDGEYVEDGGLEATIAAFRRRTGNGVLWLFDAVPLDEWRSGKASRQPLDARKRRLRANLLEATNRQSGIAVGYIEHLPVNAGTIEQCARDLWSQGYEGLVIKNAASLYVRKRSCDWMKVKLRTVSKMRVVDVMGCTRNGREEAKSLLVSMPGAQGCRTTKVPVSGGGLAETIWMRRGDLVGTLVDVEHSGFTGAGNPREAILKTVRF